MGGAYPSSCPWDKLGCHRGGGIHRTRNGKNCPKGEGVLGDVMVESIPITVPFLVWEGVVDG